MVIGIPRAFLYHRYGVLWETFFETLGFRVVVSGPTTKEIISKGSVYAIDEACLSSKIFLGHVESLIGQCDVIFIPRIANFGNKQILCTKFFALHDIVANTFRAQGIKLLDFNIDVRRSQGELAAFMSLGRALKKRRSQVAYAYMLAKQSERNQIQNELSMQRYTLTQKGTKILVVGHGYNVEDAFVGKPILDMLEELGTIPVKGDIVDRKLAAVQAKEITDTLPWIYNRELVGSIQIYKEQVDGIVLLSTFPCGPDSLVNDIILRRVKDKPMLNLIVDNQDGMAGIETRLESFVDIIQFRL